MIYLPISFVLPYISLYLAYRYEGPLLPHLPIHKREETEKDVLSQLVVLKVWVFAKLQVKLLYYVIATSQGLKKHLLQLYGYCPCYLHSHIIYKRV